MTDSQLTAALQEAAGLATESPTGPLPEPTPLQSNVPNAAAPDLRVVETAVGDGVTVDDESEPVSFEEAYLAETLGIDPDAEEEAGSAEPDVADPSANLTDEQRRIAELERQLADIEAEKITAQADQVWVNKWEEGKNYFERLEDQVRSYGQANGRSEYEVEVAVQKVLRDEQDWDRRFFLAREVGIREAERSARGADAISVILKENGLTAADRPRLAQFATNPEQMKLVAQIIKSERDAVAARDQKIKTKATRNVAQRISQDQIVPQGPGTPRRLATKVKGSDAELEIMIANRPTALRARQRQAS